MTFLAPMMLWGVLAAAIPIALHFFYRSRYRTIPWAAMKFLLDSIEQTSRRMKFQELLLLILRVTLLLLLALALARPSTDVAGAGEGAAVNAVFLFDVSMSMGASDGGPSRLKRAQDTALSILGQMPPHSTVQIITCADRADMESVNSSAADASEEDDASKKSLITRNILGLLGPRSPLNLNQARTIIEELKPTSLGSDLKDGIVLANIAVNRAPKKGNKELYIFTDMQTSAWDTHPTDVRSTMEEISKNAFVTVVRCGQQELNNAAIVNVRSQTNVPRPGERVDFAVEVRHTSGKDIPDLQLTLLVDGQETQGMSKKIELLKKGTTETVTMTGKLDKPGLHTITVLMNKDDMPGDNRFDYVVRVPDYYRTLIVDGGTNDPEDKDKQRFASSYYLMHQMAPVKESDYARYHVQSSRVRSKAAAPGLLNKLDLCVLVNCEMPSADKDEKNRSDNVLSHAFLKELKEYVHGGGSLLIYAGDQVKSRDYNKVLLEKYDLLPVPLKGDVKDFGHKDPLKINRESFKLSAFQKFKRDKLYDEFNNIEVYKAFEVEEPTRKEVKPEKPKEDSKERLTEAEQQDWDKKKAEEAKKRAEQEKKEQNISVLLRYKNKNDELPAVVSRKIGEGEVIFVTTSADPGFSDKDKDAKGKTEDKDVQHTWNNWAINPLSPVFIKSILSHLAAGSSQEHNYTAGKTLIWNAREKSNKTYTLYHPKPELPKKEDGKPAKKDDKSDLNRKVERLGLPENTLKLQVGSETLFWERDLKKIADGLKNPGFVPGAEVSFIMVPRHEQEKAQLVQVQLLLQGAGKLKDMEKDKDAKGQIVGKGKITDVDASAGLLSVERTDEKKSVVRAHDLYFAGIYNIRPMDPANEGKEDESEAAMANRSISPPVAVVPDNSETENFRAFVDQKEFDSFLGIKPPVRHLLAGSVRATTTGIDRLNREWTVWILWALLILALCEVALAYWCGRAW